ncbi:MAG: phenylacetate-CoA ligase [Acetobacterium sp.]|jgi:phenylacetate-CoA ligase|uniref:phenylacetate--CoA ligase family protein n=1 Tax=unclassified Acetobacterium TaxID=2638182 RepID=UPI000DBEC746|nr:MULTISPECIES: phenylacetate--CoA ligase [unclassified Acetobacterium]AWW26315.1 phenylacetate--CoA ligase [Acetobacterium sp. KB-1]MDK2940891.1 phenylacetate-CoA ligase [Acetobacterium sp.]MDZ5726280.1 phenylacetate--CoA ligase [Acetobacterium sp. K1/6]
MKIWSEKEKISREEIRKLQFKRLMKTLHHVYENVPYYHEKFKAAGVKPVDIRSLKDLRLLPLTTKEDLRKNYPFGLFAVPKNKIVRYHASSGTTGKPTVVGYTKNDLKVWREVIARIVTMGGVTNEDTAQITFGFGLFTGAFGLQQGLEKVGAGVIPISSGNTKKQIMIMQDFQSTVLIGTPSYALHLAETAQEMGIDPKEELFLNYGLFGGEGSTEEMRAKLNEAWGIISTENYGMSELIGPGVSGECQAFNGMHINEDHFIAEIIDPETLEVLPEGSVGELVITPITKEGLPLIRYRTKDITQLDTTPCDCGRTSARMAKITGRTDDMLIIGGVNVFPSQIEGVLLGIKGIGSNYQIRVLKKGYLDRIEIDVEVINQDLLVSVTLLDQLYKEIESKLHTILGIHAGIHLVEPKSLVRSEGKAKRVIDLRS